VVVLLALVAAPRMLFESRRLLLGQALTDATDLRVFHEQCVTWLSGNDIYATLSAAYPPGTYPLICPMYVLDDSLNRWIWFGHAIFVLGLLTWMCVRASGADSLPEKFCALLIPLAMYSTGVALGNGQLTIHALTAAAAAVVVLHRSRGRWRYELAAAACMLFALIKPSLTAPFFWIFVFVPQRKWAALFILGGYVVLTWLGASFQAASLLDQFKGFIAGGSTLAVSAGYGNVPLWLTQAGYEGLIVPFTVVALLAMGVWVWANRHADRWLLLGGLAIMARLWAYHRLYDDMLNLFALIALMRLAKGCTGSGRFDQMAWLMLPIALTTIPGPATPLEFSRGWISLALCSWQTAVRFLMLAVIMHRAWIQQNQAREKTLEGEAFVIPAKRPQVSARATY
jgi:hypothetical protein